MFHAERRALGTMVRDVVDEVHSAVSRVALDGDGIGSPAELVLQATGLQPPLAALLIAVRILRYDTCEMFHAERRALGAMIWDVVDEVHSAVSWVALDGDGIGRPADGCWEFVLRGIHAGRL